jgi:hypothetical protein
VVISLSRWTKFTTIAKSLCIDTAVNLAPTKTASQQARAHEHEPRLSMHGSFIIPSMQKSGEAMLCSSIHPWAR